MARFVDAIDLPVPPEVAFDYLAAFHQVAEWDPGVAEAEPLTPGPAREGSRFRVVVAFLGRRIPFEYTITEYDRPHRLILEGSDGSMLSLDELTFSPRQGGTRITYEAKLELRGLARFGDPLFDLAFQVIGRLAARGLRERFANARDAHGRKVA